MIARRKHEGIPCTDRLLELFCPRHTWRGTVNLSGRVSRMQATGRTLTDLLPPRATDFRPDLEFLGPEGSMVRGSDMIAAEVEQVIDLVVG
jgi:hypothetical protein